MRTTRFREVEKKSNRLRGEKESESCVTKKQKDTGSQSWPLREK